jgi:hypothetical protein
MSHPLKRRQLARNITLGFPRVPLTIDTMLPIDPIAHNDSAAMNTTGSGGLTFSRKLKEKTHQEKRSKHTSTIQGRGREVGRSR